MQQSESLAEKRFFDALRDVFVGAKVEGESGFVNLMRIKSRYYEKGVFPQLKKDIDEALAPFPDFRQELFERLYTFFRRYFSESGSIYFRFTPPHEHVYEKVYTDDRDVMLFWKTHMLYYVKTDRLFRSMSVEVDDFRFFFDVSTLEHKRANEKRSLVFEFKERRKDGTLVFAVAYSERGRKTKMTDIRRAIKDALGLKKYSPAVPSEEVLERAFRLFERQSEVDYFINKDARRFLQEQFNLWLYQYVFEPKEEGQGTVWTAERIQQLQVLKKIAYKIIDFIAQFENELVRIWNKPKFVLESHYVITLDRIAAQEGGEEVLQRLLSHPGMEAQVQEWRNLGMVEEDFRPKDILVAPLEQPAQLDLFSVARERNLVTTGYHLPYNPELVARARELRKHMTPAETKLWHGFLRHFRHRVLRQRPIDHFIVDFYCPALKLVIEIDGEQHYTEEGKGYDAERDAILQGYGLRVIRFRNEEVLNDFERVCKEIEAVAEGSPLSPSREGGDKETGEGETPAAVNRSPLSPAASGGSPLSPLNKGGEGGRGRGGINPRYQHLPIDTKHFPDLELAILGLFDHLDQALDGWLIHSENYQALRTLLPKFREKVQVIYIDPPYNSEASEIFYFNNYKDASWLTLIANRLDLSRHFLTRRGILCVTIDDVEFFKLRGLLSALFGDEYMLGTVAIRSNPAGRSTVKGFSISHEYAIFVADSLEATIGRIERTPEQIARYDREDAEGRYEWVNFRKHGGANAMRTARPRLFYPIYVTETTLRIPRMHWDEEREEWIPDEEPSDQETVLLPVSPEGEERTWKWGHETARKRIRDLAVRRDQQGKLGVYMKARLRGDGRLPPTWWDKSLYSATDYGTNLLKKLFGVGQKFSFPKSVYATMDCIKVASSSTDALVLDFFAGSGTTAHAVINLNREDGGRRRYILVEMADYFHTVLLPRVKKVVFSDKWKGGKAQEDGKGISHFAKYFRLEQYEETLRKARYKDDDEPLFVQADPYTQYVFLRDTKMMDNAETGERVVEIEGDEVRVDLSKLYPNIDVAETLSCVTGKWIRRVHPDPDDPTRPGEVEFEDGTRVDLNNPPWELVKPLIWW